MPSRSILSYFALTIVLRSSVLCDGRSEEEAAVQGSHHLSRVEVLPAASTRPGSLTFTYDQRGDFNDTGALHSAKLRRLAPSVRCGSNHMTLSVKRRGTHHFLVDSGEVPLPPLSQMPSTCGFFVKRSRRDVQYAASYQGCHVNKQEDEYSLPLRLWGTPMTMSCPDMLPLPSILCFPNKMLVKIRGVAASELRVKVSGTWQPLPSACSSCRLTLHESAGELMLIAPYNKDLCVDFKDEEYFLSLQWADFELTASCPPIPHADLTAGTAAPPSGSDKALHLQYPQLPIFSQFLEPRPTQSPGLVAPLPFSFVAADFSETQTTPGNTSLPLLPKFYLFPRPESAARPPGDDEASVNRLQLPETPLSRYQIPLFQEFPVMPGGFPPTTTVALPATSAETKISTPAPSADEKPQLSLQPDFPVMRPYPFPPFPGYPQAPQDETSEDAESKPQQPHPQLFQLPMFPFNQISQLQKSPSEAPPSERAPSQPHPYIPMFVVSKRAPIPVFLHRPASTSSDQQEHPPFYPAVQPFYQFLPDQSGAALTNT